MKKKYYAVKEGRNPGIYESWEACRKEVDGFPGALYQGFAEKEEALRYLGQEAEEASPEEGCAVAYVDGSYQHAIGAYAFGCVLLLPGGEMVEENGSGNDPEAAKLRNVTGEMIGAMTAVQWCLKHGYRELDLYYDYLGIEMWATGRWKTNLELTRKYADYMKRNGERLKIRYHKVKAHTGDRYNERADSLARQALEEMSK